MKYTIFVAFMAMVFAQAECKVFTRCDLVRQLRSHGFPEHELRDWVCLVEHESRGDTRAMGKLNQDGSTDYGLFQINDRYWCDTNRPGKECNVACNDLLLDDITIAVGCVKKIYSVHGFQAWVAWKNYCQGRPLPDIHSC